MARPSKPLKGIDPIVTISEAVQYTSGSQRQLAAALGTTPETVSVWKRTGGKLPPLFAYRFVSLFKHHQPRHEN